MLSRLFDGVNVRDIGYKALWTGVAAVLGYLATEATEISAAWAPIAAMVANVALAWVRQHLGATPPDAPATGAFAK